MSNKKTTHKKVLRNTLGPALVLAAWDQVAQAQSTNFNYTGGFQTWTVPATGLYRITAFGAQGGSDGYAGTVGGFGAEIGGDFSLTSGQVLSIAVGGAGGVACLGYAGGGGGGGACGGPGGFGGGSGSFRGGGGGYSGGYGGYRDFGFGVYGFGGGGGGGSFNAGLNPIGVAGFRAGNGLVEIMVVPTLSITNSAPGYATVSWAPASTNWVLQENLNLGTTNWVNSPSGTNNPVTVPANQSAKFYRLLKQ